MRVVVTRAENEAARMGSLLQKAGCTMLVAPMMEIDFVDAPVDLEPYQAVVATSANAVRGLAKATEERGVRVYCVGKPTDDIAQELGFTNTEHSIGTHNNLVNFIKRYAKPEDGPMLYLHGEVVTGTPVQDLRRNGFKMAAKLMYKAVGAKGLPDAVREEISGENPPEVVTFLSIRTYRLFREVLEKEGLLGQMAKVTAVCISPAVADFAREIRWKSVLTAKEMTARSVVGVIEEMKENTSSAS